MKLSRQLFIRIGFVVLLIVLAVVMYHIGKQHTILIDNNRTEDGIRALDWAEVSVDGQPGLEMYPRMRDQAIVVGQKHTIEITYTNDDWEDEVISVDVTVPVNQNMVLFSLPKFLEDPSASQDVWLTPFFGMTAPVEEETTTEEVVTDEFSMGI